MANGNGWFNFQILGVFKYCIFEIDGTVRTVQNQKCFEEKILKIFTKKFKIFFIFYSENSAKSKIFLRKNLKNFYKKIQNSFHFLQ